MTEVGFVGLVDAVGLKVVLQDIVKGFRPTVSGLFALSLEVERPIFTHYREAAILGFPNPRGIKDLRLVARRDAHDVV